MLNMTKRKNITKGDIANALHSTAADHVTAVAEDVFDENLQEYQSDINSTRKKELAKTIDKAIFPGLQGGPLMHVIAAKAVCFHEALKPEFKAYQQQVVKNAATLAQALVANGMRIVSGGTDNHLMLVDLTSTGRTGKEVEALLDAANITVNKNTIPFETRSPFVTSGIRIGTPAVTTRGLKENDMLLIASFISRIAQEGESAVESVKEGVLALCAQHPLY